MTKHPEKGRSAGVSQGASCRACGETINPKRGDVLVESIDDSQGRSTRTILWHQACYNRFLDDGEEC